MGGNSAEQQARDLLERMEVEGAQSYSAGELVELANLIAETSRYRRMMCHSTGKPKSECGCLDVCPGCGRVGHEDKPKCYLC